MGDINHGRSRSSQWEKEGKSADRKRGTKPFAEASTTIGPCDGVDAAAAAVPPSEERLLSHVEEMCTSSMPSSHSFSGLKTPPARPSDLTFGQLSYIKSNVTR